MDFQAPRHMLVEQFSLPAKIYSTRPSSGLGLQREYFVMEWKDTQLGQSFTTRADIGFSAGV